MARLPLPGRRGRRGAKSAATTVVEGVAAVTAELAKQAAQADRLEAERGEEPAEAIATPPPPPLPPPPPPPPRLAPAARPTAAGGYSRTSKAVTVVGAAAPLAVAALAMAAGDAHKIINPVSKTPSVSISAGGAAAAPLPPRADLPAPPPDFVPAECLKQFQLDLPVHRGDDIARRQTKICREGYLLSFNVDTQSPDWVMERLKPADLVGPASRTDKFIDDPAIPPQVDADNADYLKTGFDRGHQAPAADAKFNQTIMDQSFYFTNMSPQRGIGMNRGAWKFLEEATRSWVMCGGHPDLYVITGPIYGTLEGNPRSIGTPPVAVPRAYYKIVYDPNVGRAVGFVLPNTKIGSRINLQDYVWKIADIETETGLNFFATQPQRTQAQLEEFPGVAWAHNGPCPGDTGGD